MSFIISKVKLQIRKLISEGIMPYLWIIFSIFMVYHVTIGYGYSPLDDPVLIVEKIGWLQTPHNILNIFTSEYRVNLYRPLLILSFMIDAMAGGGSPWSFHFTNILLHIFASILVFRLLIILRQDRFNSALLTLVFALHSVQIHSIAWIPGRNDILLSIFVLLTIINSYRFSESQNFSHYFFQYLFFLLALLTKETAVIIPIMIGIIIHHYFRSKFPNYLKKILPIFIVISMVWVALKWNAGKPGFTFGTLFDGNQIENLIILFITSFGKLVLPLSQKIVPYYESIPVDYTIITCVTLAILITFRSRLDSMGIIGVGWILLFLFPGVIWSVFILKDNIFYEHRLYLPLIGWILVLSSLKERRHLLFGYGLAVILISGYSISTRLDLYSNPRSFADHCVKESPDCAKSFIIKGELSIVQGNYFEGLSNLQYSIRLKPDSYQICNRIGYIFYKIGMPDSAQTYYLKAVELNPEFAEGFYNIGNLYLEVDNFQKAIRYYTLSISADSMFIPSYNNRAVSHYMINNFADAWTDLLIVKNSGYPVNDDFYRELETKIKQ